MKATFVYVNTYLMMRFSSCEPALQYTPHLCSRSRSLLQQLQKLQALVSGKVVPRSCKMASTQTGTCLMVGVSALLIDANRD